MNILITGGAGFVGASLAKCFVGASSSNKVTVFDNLHRRGSELNLGPFKKLGVNFIHGDVRGEGDLGGIKGDFDFLIEASAEPSVASGLDGETAYLTHTNLVGALNCLEWAKKKSTPLMFLSTSRVYSLEPLQSIKLLETPTRFEPEPEQKITGLTKNGITEEFSLSLPRSLYGATKFSAEILIQEYCASFGIPTLINRCSNICGPGQFGKSDQGIYALWIYNHIFDKSLCYTGFGGKGKQVRDLLHPFDLFTLIQNQMKDTSAWKGRAYNVGGGLENSASLLEFTSYCQNISGNKIEISNQAATTPVDVAWYISDTTKVRQIFSWEPSIKVERIVKEIAKWVEENRDALSVIYK